VVFKLFKQEGRGLRNEAHRIGGMACLPGLEDLPAFGEAQVIQLAKTGNETRFCILRAQSCSSAEQQPLAAGRAAL
jgi:hypothetical protein